MMRPASPARNDQRQEKQGINDYPPIAFGRDFPGVWLWDPRTGRSGWIGWGGLLDTEPACGWVRGLAAYRHSGEPAIATAGYHQEIHSFRVAGSAAFRGF